MRARLPLALAEFVMFVLKQGWSAFPGALLLAGLIISDRIWQPHWPIARFDALLIYALALQALFLATGMESWREARVIALFHLTGTPGLGEFVAFCVELTQRLQNPQDYNINPNLFSASKAADISKLFGSALMGGKMETVFDTAAEAAGFQIALWEVVYETGSSYDMASGSFKAWGFDNNAALSAAVNDKAKDYLDGMANAPMPVLLFLENDDYQDLVTVVPLPAAGFLLAFGVAGLGLAGRRKKA